MSREACEQERSNREKEPPAMSQPTLAYVMLRDRVRSAPSWPTHRFATRGMASSSRAIHASARRISVSSRFAASITRASAGSSTSTRCGFGDGDGSPYRPAPSRAALLNATTPRNPMRSRTTRPVSPGGYPSLASFAARDGLGCRWGSLCSSKDAVGQFDAVVDLRPTGLRLLRRVDELQGVIGCLNQDHGIGLPRGPRGRALACGRGLHLTSRIGHWQKIPTL